MSNNTSGTTRHGCMPCPLTRDQRQMIINQINSESWQHSDRLPRDEYGVDWNDPRTLYQIAEILNGQIVRAAKMLSDAKMCERILGSALNEMAGIDNKTLSD